MLRERSAMRLAALALILAAPAAAANAQAGGQTADDARSATAACLSAVIDNAPVGDVQEGDIAIRRGQDPVSCTVTISGGQPVVIRDAMLAAVKKRSELFTPTKTLWEPGEFASREAFCNLSLRRHLNVVVATGKPGGSPVAVATVFEAPKRDERCDRDMGVQKVAQADAPAAESQPTTETPPAPAAEPQKPAKPAAASKSLRSRIPKIFGLGPKG
jgi:hypothetical protein